MLTFWLSFCFKFLLFVTISFRLFADHGKVLKTINAASADDSSKVSSVVIEELDVLAKPEPIRNLKIVRTMQYGEFDVSLFSGGWIRRKLLSIHVRKAVRSGKLSAAEMPAKSFYRRSHQMSTKFPENFKLIFIHSVVSEGGEESRHVKNAICNILKY